jgi:hypothetical protein
MINVIASLAIEVEGFILGILHLPFISKFRSIFFVKSSAGKTTLTTIAEENDFLLSCRLASFVYIEKMNNGQRINY